MATVSMTMNLALAFALVPVMGLEGAALSTSISYTCAAVYLVGRFAHVSGAHDIRGYLPGRRELRDYVRLVLSLAPGR
jgi:Na+-driven multidrug efflux pump